MTEETLDTIQPKKQKPAFKIRGVIIWSLLVLISIAFRLMNWPGLILLLFSTAGLFAYNFSAIWFESERNTLNKTISIGGGIWFFILLYGVQFNHGYPVNFNGLSLFFYFSVFLTIVYCIAFKVIHTKRAKKSTLE